MNNHTHTFREIHNTEEYSQHQYRGINRFGGSVIYLDTQDFCGQ